MQLDRKSYSIQKYRLAIISLILPLVAIIAIITTGAASYVKEFSVSISANDYINLLSFSLIISVFYYIAVSPLKYYSTFALEHKYSLSNQTRFSWLKKELKEVFVASILGAPLICALYAFIRYWPLEWWILASGLWFLTSALLAKFAPLLIVPFFYKCSPLKNAALKNKLAKLASMIGFRPEGIYEINLSKDTKKANAAVLGLGRQKRIVLSDTLIENFTEPEIETVMSHELAHHKLRHTLKLILFSGASIVLIFSATNILFFKLHETLRYNLLYDFESLLLIYAIITTFGILILPIHNAFSRKLEKDADLFALNLTQDAPAFVSTMTKLSEMNLADANPGRFYEIMLYDHPPISRRISLAEAFGRAKK